MMAGYAITRWVVRAVQWIPQPLHRALDAWSQRLARQRRLKRHKARRPA